MNLIRLSFVLLFALFLCGACHREPTGSIQTKRTQKIKIFTKAELDTLIVQGMSAVDVTNKFGPPGSAFEIDQNVVLLTYSFPLEPQEEGLHLAGFSIYIKGGKVIRWSPITGESRKTIQAGGYQRSNGEQPFELFLVTDSLTNVLKTFDSEGSAVTSSLKISPDLAFKAKVFAGSSVPGNSGEITVILVLNDQDAPKLKELTENNFGKRTLLVCRNKVIAAPAISEPITSKQLKFNVKDPMALDSLRSGIK